MHIQNYCI